MKLNANNRQAAARIAAKALEFCAEVKITNVSGFVEMYDIEFDERVVMSEREIDFVRAAEHSLGA